MLMENWALSREEAARVVGLTEAQLKNYQTRYAPFPEKKEGTGRPTSYDFSDIVNFAVMVQMIEDGFAPSQAAEAVSPYASMAPSCTIRAPSRSIPARSSSRKTRKAAGSGWITRKR